jgi:hypothetical protein
MVFQGNRVDEMSNETIIQLQENLYTIPTRDKSSTRADALYDLYTELVRQGLQPSDKIKDPTNSLGIAYRDMIGQLVANPLIGTKGDITNISSSLANEILTDYINNPNKTIKETQDHLLATIPFYDPIANDLLLLQYYWRSLSTNTSSLNRATLLRNLVDQSGLRISGIWNDENGVSYNDSPEANARLIYFIKQMGYPMTCVKTGKPISDTIDACFEVTQQPMTDLQQKKLNEAIARFNLQEQQGSWEEETETELSLFSDNNNNLGLRILGLASLSIAGALLVYSFKKKDLT